MLATIAPPYELIPRLVWIVLWYGLAGYLLYDNVVRRGVGKWSAVRWLVGAWFLFAIIEHLVPTRHLAAMSLAFLLGSVSAFVIVPFWRPSVQPDPDSGAAPPWARTGHPLGGAFRLPRALQAVLLVVLVATALVG